MRAIMSIWGSLADAGPQARPDRYGSHALRPKRDARHGHFSLRQGALDVLTPLEAIKIGPLSGAIYLSHGNEIGSVTVGKRADLIIVNGDPSKRTPGVEDVQFVLRDGIGFDSPKLLSSVKGLYGRY